MAEYNLSYGSYACDRARAPSVCTVLVRALRQRQRRRCERGGAERRWRRSCRCRGGRSLRARHRSPDNADDTRDQSITRDQTRGTQRLHNSEPHMRRHTVRDGAYACDRARAPSVCGVASASAYVGDSVVGVSVVGLSVVGAAVVGIVVVGVRVLGTAVLIAQTIEKIRSTHHPRSNA